MFNTDILLNPDSNYNVFHSPDTFKAALISIFILMHHMTMCNVKGVARSDEPIIRLCSSSQQCEQSILTSFISVFGFHKSNFTVLVQCCCFNQHKNALKAHCTLPARHQTAD